MKTVEVEVGKEFSLQLTAIDPDGDTVTFELLEEIYDASLSAGQYTLLYIKPSCCQNMVQTSSASFKTREGQYKWIFIFTFTHFLSSPVAAPIPESMVSYWFD